MGDQTADLCRPGILLKPKTQRGFSCTIGTNNGGDFTSNSGNVQKGPWLNPGN